MKTGDNSFVGSVFSHILCGTILIFFLSNKSRDPTIFMAAKVVGVNKSNVNSRFM